MNVKKVRKFFKILWRLPWVIVACIGMVIYLIAIWAMEGWSVAEKQFHVMK